MIPELNTSTLFLKRQVVPSILFLALSGILFVSNASANLDRPAVFPPSPPRNFHQTYIVKPGDCLRRVFVSLNRKGAQWPEVLEANRQFKNPDLIFLGDTVMIPDPWSEPVGKFHRVQTVTTAKVKIPTPDSPPTVVPAIGCLMGLLPNTALAETESFTDAQSPPPADEGAQCL